MNKQSETVKYQGIIGEIVHTAQPDGRIYEKYSRPPGVRVVIVSPENKILITREFRQETGDYDLRLPGGKVCDTLADYKNLQNNEQDIFRKAKEAAIKEALEETGLVISEPDLIAKAGAGATVEWDLYYFITRDYKESDNGQQLETGEEIEVTWMTLSEIRLAISQSKMQEWRTVGVLLGLVLPAIENS